MERQRNSEKMKGVNVLFRNIPFMFFLMTLGLVYIANAHYAEKKIRVIESLKKDVKALKWEYWSLQSEIMYGSTQSELGRQVSNEGLTLPEDSPKRILIRSKK